MHYTGQLSFDFVDRDGGLFIIECNPRSTDGILLVSADHLAAGITDPSAPVSMVEPGTETQLDFAVVAELFEEPLRQSPATIHDLLYVRDVGHGWRDHMPMVWSVATLVHGARLSHHDKVAVLEAMADDVVWNGEPIDGMSAATRRRSPRSMASGCDRLDLRRRCHRTTLIAMALARNGSVDLYYETFGDPADPTLVLVNGL